MSINLEQTAEAIAKLALDLGADQVTVSVSQSVSTELTQREQKLEKTKQANSLGVGLEILVDDKYSSHSASDIRLESLRPFLQRALELTSFLEKDENRRLGPLLEMGSTTANIDVFDDSWKARTATERKEQLVSLEAQCRETAKDADVRSIASHVWDSQVQSHVFALDKASPNERFSTGWKRTSFGMGAEITLVGEDGRLPEAYDFRSARHLSDLPSMMEISETLLKKGNSRLVSSALPSARLPLLIENRVVSKIISAILTPISGTAIYEKRSCLLGKLGEQIGASNLNIFDNPHVHRGLASRPFDGDGFPTQKRPIIENGRLSTYLINLYNSRRLKTDRTTGSTTNIIIPPSESSPQELLNLLPKAIVVEGFLGGNTNPITGDFSLGITGRYFENGEFIQGVSEMNISGNILELLERFETSANDVWKFSSTIVPSLLFSDIQCSGL